MENTKDKIIKETKKAFAIGGYESISMRTLATTIGIAPSVLYHYYGNKEAILKDIFEITRKGLGIKRAKLENQKDTYQLLKNRIEFQFNNAEDVIYILKYYAHFRDTFEENSQGFVPIEAYKHIKEVLNQGIDQGIFLNEKVDSQAKVITHAINGFILEYYPNIPANTENNELIDDIAEFIYRGIKKREGV